MAEATPSDATAQVVYLYANAGGMAPTVFFEYHDSLEEKRSRAPGVVRVALPPRSVQFWSYWERNVVKNAMQGAGLARAKRGSKTKLGHWRIFWGKHFSAADFYSRVSAGYKVNHFPGSWVIGRKDRLRSCVGAVARRFPAEYTFLPKTYVLPADATQLAAAVERSPRDAIWIQKPPAGSCGRGIKLLRRTECNALLSKCRKKKKKKKKKVLVQQYIAQPHLIDGKKYDIRVYVLVTSFDPLVVYQFDEGIVRFCTQAYDLSDFSNKTAHLTNYSLNKDAEGFVANETAENDGEGSKWSHSALYRYINAQVRSNLFLPLPIYFIQTKI